MWILSLLVALASWRFIAFGVEASMNFMLYHAQQRPLFFFAHVGFAPLALLLMPVQFWTDLRRRRPAVHRWIGRVYAVSVLLSGIGGMLLASQTEAGTVAGLGFGLLGVVWVSVTARAVWLAREKRIAEHRVWMIRSAALTFAAVTLRIYLAVSQILGWPFDLSYTVISWACWVPNALVVEYWLLRSKKPAKGGL
ncbi:DUF2306 domain-containing protein [Thalassovita taeanensis]|uniref:DUF2306 domain-containing protein n=1 Tax=Thalassovita taeanensis TaxID=657014 RepID=UPI001FE5A877|nr:DUF2306 domain-containing protein [Thalassovita taeanensis]